MLPSTMKEVMPPRPPWPVRANTMPQSAPLAPVIHILRAVEHVAVALQHRLAADRRGRDRRRRTPR